MNLMPKLTMTFPVRFLVTLAAVLFALQLAAFPPRASASEAPAEAQTQAQLLPEDRMSQRQPRDFRGNTLVLATGGTLVFLALFFIFRALRGAKRENTPKAWHE